MPTTAKGLTTPANSDPVAIPADLAVLSGQIDALFADLLTKETLKKKALLSPRELWGVYATVATGTINHDVGTTGILYYTSNASANHTLNARWSSTVSLDSILSVGDSVTIVWAVTNGATPYYPNVFQVDGVTITPKWSGVTAPTAGNASAVDVYSYVILKTGAAAFTVFASQTKFA